jgi:hypothetical protein
MDVHIAGAGLVTMASRALLGFHVDVAVAGQHLA